MSHLDFRKPPGITHTTFVSTASDSMEQSLSWRCNRAPLFMDTCGVTFTILSNFLYILPKNNSMDVVDVYFPSDSLTTGHVIVCEKSLLWRKKFSVALYTEIWKFSFAFSHGSHPTFMTDNKKWFQGYIYSSFHLNISDLKNNNYKPQIEGQINK